MIINQLTLERT